MIKIIKKVIMVLLVTFSVAAALFVVLAVADFFGSKSLVKYIGSVEKVEKTDIPEYFIDDAGYYSFIKEDNSDFKILQLTDIHLGGGALSLKKDRMALEAIVALANSTKPDLIIITGDMVYPVPIQSGSSDNLKSAKYLGTLMYNLGIPWTITFGNHDTEEYAKYTKDEIADYYMSVGNCLFQKGPSDIAGIGNTIINVRNTEGKIVTALVLIDSNMYTDGKFMDNYDNIHDDQVDWYVSRIKELSEGSDSVVPSLAFWHIPVNEYSDAWQLYKKGSSEVGYIYGRAGEKDEKVFAPKYRGNIFDVMSELGSTKGIFCGHDHLNDFSVVYRGIRLTYGQSIDYLAYLGIAKTTWQRGGTVIEIDSDSSFTVTPVILEDLKD